MEDEGWWIKFDRFAGWTTWCDDRPRDGMRGVLQSIPLDEQVPELFGEDFAIDSD